MIFYGNIQIPRISGDWKGSLYIHVLIRLTSQLSNTQEVQTILRLLALLYIVTLNSGLVKEVNPKLQFMIHKSQTRR